MSAVLLSSVWVGLAEGAASRAHAYVRAQDRKRRAQQPGGEKASSSPPLEVVRLAELAVVLHQLRQVLAGAANDYERCKDTTEIETFAFSSRMDHVKVSTSTLAGEVVHRSLGICGIAGYQNGSPYSLGRIIRDVTAAPLMVNNDRAISATAATLLVSKSL